MSEPLVPEPDPEPNAHHDPLPARCSFCGLILRRQGLDTYICADHGIVRAFYGNPREDEER